MMKEKTTSFVDNLLINCEFVVDYSFVCEKK